MTTSADIDESEPSILDLQQSLVTMIGQADRKGANALLDAWAARHGYTAVFKQLLEPALTDIGAGIIGQQFSLAQAYVAAKVAEDILTKIAQWHEAGPETQAPKGPVVLGNAEEDFHALGRRMVATMLRANGWTVCDLGNDVPAADYVDKALELGARVIGVSAMTMTTAQNIREVRRELDGRGLSGRIQLAVGGAAFLVVAGLCEEVGGDGTAADMLDAPRLFAELWEKAQQVEARP